MTLETAVMGQNREKHRETDAAKVSMAGSIFMTLIAGAAGLAVDSTTMLIDSATGLIMALTGFFTFLTLGRIHRPADESFNFGYHKYEPFTITAQGFLVIATCVIALKFAVQDIIHPEDIKNYYLPVAVTAFSGLTGIGIFLYLRKEAARTDSAIISMAAIHWKTDVILSFGLLSGFLLGLVLTARGNTGFTHYIDPVMTIILAAYLMKSPIVSVIQSSMELLDAAPDREVREKIKRIVDEHSPGGLGKHRVRTRKAGGRMFVDVRFDVSPDITAERMSALARGFEAKMDRYLPGADVVVFFKTTGNGLCEVS